ncbi:hypothetical protein NXS11_03905 [Staphylococcus sp. GRT3]|uniref:Uncharacterized protein n=1 Tax=Staphylococcus americanisciuri TaxID=2973940 RepID=A0ABT2F0T1_9STAP|nr:hypothetical protein [Staphylococcus americanisciuri]
MDLVRQTNRFPVLLVKENVSTYRQPKARMLTSIESRGIIQV